MKQTKGSEHPVLPSAQSHPPEFAFEVLVPEPYASDLQGFLTTQGVQASMKRVRRILGRSRLTWLMPAPRPTVIFSVSADELNIIDRLARWYEQRRFEWPLLWIGVQTPDDGWRLDFAHHTPGEIKQLVEVNNLIRRTAASFTSPGSTPTA